MKFLFILFFAYAGIIACNNKTQTSTAKATVEPIQSTRTDGLKNAYFASGCFWCVEAIFEHVKGVKEVVSGYAGGTTKNPTYRQVGANQTGHTETVEVQYNPKVIDFNTLLKVYYGSQNPTTYGQVPDFGAAYRSVIFYQNETEKKLAEAYRKEVQQNYEEKVVTEIVPFQKFYKAEDYHQNYERLNPNQSYVLRVSKPRLERFKAKFPQLVKSE